MLRFPIAAVIGILVLCLVVVLMGMYWHDSASVIQFLILAGLVVNFIDRHAQNTAMTSQIQVNVAETVSDKMDQAANKVADKVGVVADEIIQSQR